MQKLLKLRENEKKFSHIEIETRYHKEGAAGRGYYLHVDPVEIENHGSYNVTRHELFAGSLMLLNRVTRKSKKAEAEAEAEAEASITELLEHVLIKNGLELEE